MTFTTIIPEELKQQIFQSYSTSFPEDERREEDDFQTLFHHPNTEVIAISENEKVIGYLILWKVLDFIFIEHFEVFESFRGQNFGSKILELLAQKHPLLILETEPAHLSSISERRVDFYLRNYFKIFLPIFILSLFFV